ncbi:CD209 antigen-like protein A [Hemibagrus wyckioides]|uniref:CD209 antigen-like protein A n=1 Tax=Hemibagrus wyckioides TaxID=337641 RepID=UPI00266D7B9B|nr:CD209 antigen-like protein A [Hemibagrus wyckioides]
MEMSEEIYANAEEANDRVNSNNKKQSHENVEDNLQTQRARSFKQSESSGGEATRGWCYRLTAVCVLLLCVLLLTATTVLGIKFNILNTENKQLQTSYNNLTKERDQLQTNYKTLTKERDQLQTRYHTLTEEKDQLQTSYNTLTTEREKLQRDKEEIQRFSKMGWIYLNPSIYYISNEEKTWTESRQDCRGRGADLVIINNEEEEEFLTTHLGSREAWIGLSDRDKEGLWTWVDGTPLITDYWKSGEPNNLGDEDCAVIWGNLQKKGWNDLQCSTKLLWICEKLL